MAKNLKIFILNICFVACLASFDSAVGQNWFPTCLPQDTWSAVAATSSGNTLFAASTGNGGLYVSTNRGATWGLSTAPLLHYAFLNCSPDGSNIVAVAANGGFQAYISNDSGFNWISNNVSGNYLQSFASSANGSVLIDGTYGNWVWISTNSGAVWQSCLSPGYYNLVGCSSIGDILIAAGGLNHNAVYFSTNYGSAWFQATNAPLLLWSYIAVSTNLDTVALEYGASLFTSTNLGITWQSNSIPGSGPIACSGDGQTFALATSSGIYTSSDAGITWHLGNVPNNITWKSIASSPDGSELMAIGNNQIYLSPPNPLTKSSVVAWDVNNYGQATVPDNLGSAIAVTGSQYDSVVVKSDGTVEAWGLNDLGETNFPPNLTNVVAVAASQQLSLALKQDGTLGWWGWSSYTNIIPSLSNVVAVAASQGNFYLILQTNGVVTAWGANGYGQTNVPVGLSNVIMIAAGDYHSMALKNDGTVAVWGGDVKGTFGVTNVPAGLSNVVAIAGGNRYCLALRSDGTIVGWPTNDVNVVMKIPSGLSNIVSIAAGYLHALALTKDGNVQEWGTVGTGLLNYQVGLSNLTAVACGYYHSLAIVGDGSPTVVQQPWNQTHYAGFPTFMYAGVVGAPPLAYQWQLNGTNIEGATNYILNLSNIRPSNVGAYSLLVSNESGITVSSNGWLTVVTNSPAITLQPTNQSVTIGSNVAFTVAIGTGPIPNVFQWQFDGTNILDATNSVLTLTNIQLANQGSYSVLVNNGYGTTTSSNAYLTVLPDLPTALNATSLPWSTSGFAQWFAQTNFSHDGYAAAQSGYVPNSYGPNNYVSTLQTTVTGPGTLTFWWNFSPLTTPYANTLSVTSSLGNVSASVDSTTGWEQRSLYLGDGEQTVTWTYSRYRFISAPSTGYVDQVSFTPGATKPTVTFMTPDTYVRANSVVGLSVNAFGTPPLAYQWQLNGTNLPNKTTPSLVFFGAQPTNSGVYSITITNDYGSITTNVTLRVGQFSLNTSSTNLFLSTNGFQMNLDGILTTNPVVILGSTDLVNWLPIFTNPPTTGTLQFIDVNATNLPARFYRARE